MRDLWKKAFIFTVFLSTTTIPPEAQAQTASTGKTSSATARQAGVPEGRTDAAIQDRIEHRLATDASVKKYDIAVKVNNGAVTLDGAVASDAQKAEATKLANVTGVAKVDNQIKVDKGVDRTLGERAKSGRTKTGEAITDAWITAKVKWFFIGEDSLKGSDINVDTNNHVVTLKGSVASAAGKARAVQLAKEADGVSRVDDQVLVKATPAKSKTTH
jgi:hyperosmotically inducible protein